MHPTILPAQRSDARLIAQILTEAALWLRDSGKPLWESDDFTEEKITPQVHLYHLALVDSEAAGLFKLESSDDLFWPDIEQDQSLFLHKFAIRRSHAGKGLSTIMMQHAVEETRRQNKKYLRLDCEASRPRLRAVYENFGFIHHSDRKVGPFLAARYVYTVKSNRPDPSIPFQSPPLADAV